MFVATEELLREEPRLTQFAFGRLLAWLDDVIDVEHPEIVLYEPLPGGGVQLTGADYIVFAKDWNKKH